MKLNGKACRTLYFDDESQQLMLLDQTLLPFKIRFIAIDSLSAICQAISSMQVRGAPAIGATAAFGLLFQARVDATQKGLEQAAVTLKATRPTAVNLAWAVDRVLAKLLDVDEGSKAERYALALKLSLDICEQDVACNKAIGKHGADIIQALYQQKQQTIHILTHCNAGWLATVDWGTALAPIYQAHEQGVDLHVWVDETRPRNQGAMLTVFELAEQGVPHTLISDNSGGHLMQCGEVDLCIVGSDRTAANGDVCNKIGTYLKALAAKVNAVPFYVALPSSTIDWQLDKGADIPIEYRSEDEVRFVTGWHEASQSVHAVRICPEQTPAINPAFDVTPNDLVSGLITEHGLFNANKESLSKLKALVNGS